MTEAEQLQAEILRKQITAKQEAAKVSANTVITNEAGSAGERALSGVKITNKGRLGFVQDLVGEDNVLQAPSGEIMFRRAENETFRPFDEAGFSGKDFFDVTGGVLESIPGVLTVAATNTPVGRGGTLLRSMVAAGAADSGGNAARQGFSAMLPGNDGLSMVDRATDNLKAAGLGMAGQGIAERVIGPGLERLNPRNAAVARPIQRSQEQPFAVKGRRLAEQNNSTLTLGQETGNRTAQFAEGVARRHIASADRVAAVDARQLADAERNLQQLTERLGTLSGKENAGNAIRRTYEGVRDAAVNVRRNQARIDFAELDRATGGSPVIPADNFVSTLDELIEAEQVIGGSPALRQLQAMRAGITNQAEEVAEDGAASAGAQVVQFGEATLVSGRLLQNSLAKFGRAANGSGQVVKDLDSADQRRIAGRLFQALENDLEEAAAREGLPDGIAQSLIRARDNYRQNSQNIRDVAEGALGRLLETKSGQTLAPEKIAEKLTNMPVSEFRQTVNFLADASPDTVANVRRSYLEEMMNKSVVTGSQKSADGSVFSMSKFNSQMLNPENAAKMRILMTRREFVQVKRVSKFMERLNDKALQGSPTAPWQQAIEFMKAMGGIATNLPAAGGAIGEMFTVRQVARAMNDPVARQAIIEISTTSEPTKRVAQAGLTLAAIMAEEAATDRTEMEQKRLEGAAVVGPLGSF